MLALLRSLRLARLLAILAVMLMTGLGQHAHAAQPADAGVAVAGIAAPGGCGDDGGALAADAHCAACHLTRATTPQDPGLSGPAMALYAAARPVSDARPEVTDPEDPARPPRRAPEA